MWVRLVRLLMWDVGLPRCTDRQPGGRERPSHLLKNDLAWGVTLSPLGRAVRLYLLEACQRICGLCCKVTTALIYLHFLPVATDRKAFRHRGRDRAAGVWQKLVGTSGLGTRTRHPGHRLQGVKIRMSPHPQCKAVHFCFLLAPV